MIKKRKEKKGITDISQEWDKIASIRLKQFLSGMDLSFDHILIPTILKEIQGNNLNAIDIGCGIGYATEKFSFKTKSIEGIDISKDSIKIANDNFKNSKRISFRKTSIQNLANRKLKKYNLGIANMSLMDMPNLNRCVKSISRILEIDSKLIITITHPYFWPLYWNYHDEKWFSYWQEIQIEAPFNISKKESEFFTTHFHRPLEMYVTSLIKNGFSIIKLEEPMPNKSIEPLYPENWKYPRFLKIVCKKKYCG